MTGRGKTYDGGFYVPNDASQPTKIYYYYSEADAPVQQLGDIDAWIENAKVGKIYFPNRPVPTAEFANRLRVLVARSAARDRNP